MNFKPETHFLNDYRQASTPRKVVRKVPHTNPLKRNTRQSSLIEYSTIVTLVIQKILVRWDGTTGALRAARVPLLQHLSPI